MDPFDNEGFAALWPTLFLKRSLPGAENANLLLEQIILAMDGQTDELTTHYRDNNLFDNPHPVMRWLNDCVNTTVMDFLRRQGISYEIQWSIQGWANVNQLGDYHDLHNHPHSYLSGTYYVAVPDQSAAIGTRADRSPGAISFFDPRGQANMNAIHGDGQVDPELRLVPAPGELLMWPAFVHHLVHPNLVDAARISISFNVVLARGANYLPSQS